MNEPDTIFAISFERLTWKVSSDGVAFGTFRSKVNALRAVEDARETLAAHGRRAKVVMSEPTASSANRLP